MIMYVYTDIVCILPSSRFTAQNIGLHFYGDRSSLMTRWSIWNVHKLTSLKSSDVKQ